MSSDTPSTSKIVSTALVLTGYMVGAGILALPVNLGPSGFLPALGGALAVWAVMTTTGLVLSRQPFLMENKDADMPSLFEYVLGRTGKWISVAANLLILYGLLTAYLAGVATVAVDSFHIALPEWAVILIYFCIITLLASLGDAVLQRGNAILMVLMWALFAALLVLVVPHFEGVDLGAAEMPFFISGLPILVVAFNFHNVVPSLCHGLNHDRKAITQAILLGSGIGFVMTASWAVAVFLTLPVSAPDGVDLIHAFASGQPATVPLNHLIHSRVFVNVSIAFSVVAMSTSYIGTGAGLLSFVRDVIGEKMRKPLIIWLVTFMPPLLVGVLYPNGFLSALNVVGGLGIGTLFGILPGIMLIKQSEPGSRKRMLGWFIVAFFTVVLLVECGHELGMLKISPDVQYWSHHSYDFGK
ncbi:aromatic amino acid transport family protein [Pseudodesulfovibrio sp.]|uniref:aromatic amino acid transport family protein n=1 Tax=unclassified Pseudodesulfovibrio TaxID=2661612 RepID=UPI003B00F906